MGDVFSCILAILAMAIAFAMLYTEIKALYIILREN